MEGEGDGTMLQLWKKKITGLVDAFKLAVDVTVYFENTSSLFGGHVIYSSSKRDPVAKYEIAYLHTHTSDKEVDKEERRTLAGTKHVKNIT